MEYTYKREDERANFEKWFLFTYGEKPKGDPELLRDQMLDSQEQLEEINRWNTMYTAALAAWHEKHSRTTTEVNFP